MRLASRSLDLAEQHPRDEDEGDEERAGDGGQGLGHALRPFQWRQMGLKPQGGQTTASRRSRQSPDIRLWQRATSYSTGSSGSIAASRRVISSAMREVRDFRRVRPMDRAMFSTWVSTGIKSRAGATAVHRPKSGGSRRTIQRRNRCRRLHGPPPEGSGNRCRYPREQRPRGKTSRRSASRKLRAKRSSAGPMGPAGSGSPARNSFSSVPWRPSRSRAATQNATTSRGRLKRYQNLSKARASRAGSKPWTNAAGDGPIAASTVSSWRPKRSTRP